MRRVTAIAALLAVLGVGSGVLDYLHQANHQRQAAQWAAVVAKFSGQKGSPLRSAPVEPANCPICFLLTFHTACESAPAMVILLALLAIAAARSSQSTRLALRFEHFDCRGPPIA